jgi:DNA polymerase III subunit delta'
MSDRESDLEIARTPLPTLPPWLATPAREALALRARWPHALLVSGPEGIGKRALALHFARALLCEAPVADGSACGACPGCHYVEVGQHPDLRIVEPVDVDEEGLVTPTEVIKIEAIRSLTQWSQRTSHRGGAKVAIIVPADKMHVPTANALLKTLEEPPPRTYLLLVAHQPGRLLPTIASRCQRFSVALPRKEEALAWLTAQHVRDAEPALAQAGGAPLIARDLSERGLQAERGAWLAALASPQTLSPVALAARLELGGREQRRDRLAAAIDWLIAWTSDLARIAAGGEAARNPDHANALSALSTRVARLSLFRYHRQLLLQRALIGHPLQPRLVAEALLIDYRALF